MKALHLMIHGRVQGIWFRASAQETARQLKIKGWVRNTPEGKVEAHIQGEESSVDKML
jgi:acylphosphatase